MTKEEVAQVIAYCEEKKISYKQRLEELGINPWNFYDAKRRYEEDYQIIYNFFSKCKYFEDYSYFCKELHFVL